MSLLETKHRQLCTSFQRLATDDLECGGRCGFEYDDGDREVQKLKANAKIKKGRGLDLEYSTAENDQDDQQPMDVDESMEQEPQSSFDGWTVFISGIDPYCQEEDVYEMFVKYGVIKNLMLTLDRRSGYMKPYGIVEYQTLNEAQAAIVALNGAKLLSEELTVTWCFVKAPKNTQNTEPELQIN